MGKVTVLGSFVVDLMGRTPHLPVPGETVKGSLFKKGAGGKGFNQGVAAPFLNRLPFTVSPGTGRCGVHVDFFHCIKSNVSK